MTAKKVLRPTTITIAMFLLIIANPLIIEVATAAVALPGFQSSPYYEEQVVTFKWNPEMRIHINAPAVDSFDQDKPVGLALFALPNGNTIEQTVGKVLEEGDDWHYDIQHIGAQTRFLRQKIEDYNLVTVYLEAEQKSWPTWKSQHTDYAESVKSVVEYLKSYFRDYQPFIVLTGHSGGGRFIFSFMDAFNEVPAYVERICFLDSDYGYDNDYGLKMIQWLNASTDHYLSVLAYNDSVALYNGEPIVSPTGGTWYRSRMMQKYFSNFYTFTTEEDDEFIRHEALDGRIKILLKKNPERLILHTVQVERNGFIHTMLTGTSLESDGYEYYGERIYTDLVQAEELPQSNFQVPLRSPEAMNGSQFMQSVMNMSFDDREDAILKELLTGNLPYFLRELKEFESTFADANGNTHQVKYRVMPDYLAIGSDSNFCRIPMGPITAQKAADFYGTCMPTRKLVDQIYLHAEIKLAPVTYTPVGNQNESVVKFVEHNTAIENQFKDAGGVLGQLVGGIKKDVVLSNKITDPARPNHVVIYGWHKLDGLPIQPLTNIHIDSYVDYSHGIRYLDSQITLDGETKTVQTVLKDPVLYRTLSDEVGAMLQPTYIVDTSYPVKPKSFGMKCERDSQLKIIISPDTNVNMYHVYVSLDGINFNPPLTFSANQYTLLNLSSDKVVYAKLTAENTTGTSGASELLAAVPKATEPPKMLVVNGFDRPSTGNTFDFIRQHAVAIDSNGVSFESATNDAVINGLVDLQDYAVVDYILGDESTVDESFSTEEQMLVSEFLKAGGRLFVSGAEIAWDLDYKGSPSDKVFCHDYLKAQYSADAPGDISGVYYSAEGISGGIFDGITDIRFDNGTHGTIDVKWADALIPVNGSSGIIRYKNVTTHTIGGVSFEGTFKDGNRPGRLVYLGFPFETIYPSSTRSMIMDKVLSFLYADYTLAEEPASNLPKQFFLAQNYPNPFNSNTVIQYQLPKRSDITIALYNSLGAKIRDWSFSAQDAGVHAIHWDGTNSNGQKVSSGTYFYSMHSGEFFASKKLVVLK